LYFDDSALGSAPPANPLFLIGDDAPTNWLSLPGAGVKSLYAVVAFLFLCKNLRPWIRHTHGISALN
jgi:hypothetical protein